MEKPLEILKKYWGYTEFRPLQNEIIDSVLSGADILALLPTGGGKSICFQVPALIKPGICIVISPLIALMEDQVLQLKNRGISAESIHSGLHASDIDRILDNAVHGNMKFLYLAPERLKSEIFIERLKKMTVSLVAIDESHCVSQWGHDFRPSYLSIPEIRQWIPKTPFLALTATATGNVKSDIIEYLELKKHVEFSSSFARKNIRLAVRKTDDKRGKVLEICQKIGGSGIIYADTRKHTKDYSDLLKSQGISADYYHAGLDPEKKSEVQKKWIDGQIRIICATNAFGMGIDKANVRLVIHPHLPPEPESFYQEAGRAGRDGKTSISVLVYNDQDIEQLKRNLALKYPDIDTLRRIYSLIYQEFKIAFGTGESFSSNFDLSSFGLKHGINLNTAHYGLKILEKSGILSLQNFGRDKSKMMFKISHTEVYKFQVANPRLDDLITVIIRSYGGMFEHLVPIDENVIAKRSKLSLELLRTYLTNLQEREIIEYIPKTKLATLTFLQSRVQEDYLSIPQEALELRKSNDLKRIEVMTAFAERRSCRMNVLLNYFEEKTTSVCGRCDVCTELDDMGISEKRFSEINTAVKILLKTSPLAPHKVPKKLYKFSPENVTNVLRWMIDNSEVILNQDELVQIA